MKKFFKYIGFLLATLVVVASIFIGIQFSKFNSKLEEKFPMHEELSKINWKQNPNIELGKRIYYVRNGCVECHGQNLTGVKIMENGAMGSLYGVNITPFRTKHLSDEDIVRAVRYGVHQSGRSLRFMPSFDFEGMSTDDLSALIAFLRSTPEIAQESHQNTYGPMLKILSALDKMPVVFPAHFIDHSKGFGTKPTEAATIEFGKYLANACIGCHGSEYKGGPIPGGDPSWPPAANIRLGADSRWTKENFQKMIQSGVSIYSGQPLRAPMPVNLLKQLNQTEIDAIWMFLSSLK